MQILCKHSLDILIQQADGAITPRLPPSAAAPALELDWRARSPTMEVNLRVPAPAMELPPPSWPGAAAWADEEASRATLALSTQVAALQRQVATLRRRLAQAEAGAGGKQRAVTLAAGGSMVIQVDSGVCIEVQAGEDGQLTVNAVPAAAEAGRGGRESGGRRQITATMRDS